MPASELSSEMVSVVIPCLDEAEAIGNVVRRAQQGIAKLGSPGEVVVVDNGSGDATAERAREMGARVVHEPQRGYGHAVRRGLAAAQGRYIVIADGDDTYPVDDLEPFIARLRDGYGLVNGNRFHGSLSPGAMPWSHRYLGTPLLTLLLRLVSPVRVTDSQCGMRAARSDVLRSLDLRAPGMELATEMLLRAAQHNVPITEVKITFAPRTGTSKLRTVPDGWRHLRYLLAVSPDYLFVAPGLFLLGVAAFLFTLGALAPQGIDVQGFRWQPRFAAVIAGTLGAQILWLGILTKCFFSTVGLATGDRVALWYMRHVSLERSLVFSGTLLAGGVLIEAVVALNQVGVTQITSTVDLGLGGALLLILGTQSLFGSFLAYAITSEYAWPSGNPDSGPPHSDPVADRSGGTDGG